MKNAKASAIIYIIFTVVFFAAGFISLTQTELPNLVGSIFKGIYDLGDITEILAYGRIYILACCVSLPMVIVPLGYIFTKREWFWFIYIPLQVVTLITFYNITKESFAALPLSEGSETELILGFIPLIGGVKDFFINLNTVYIWYALPIIIGLINFLLMMNIYIRDFDGNFVLRFFIYQIVMGLINFLGIPILLSIFAALGGVFAAIVGVILVIVVFSILGSFMSSPRYTAKVTDRYGNTHKIDIYD